MKKVSLVAGALLTLGISAIAFAQPKMDGGPMKPGEMQGGMMHDGGMMSGDMMQGGMQKAEGDEGPASLALRAVNDKMHRDMAIVLTGDTDADFVRSMIPHHQGAIDMAKVELAFGTDPDIRKLAETIIAAQEKEIAEMNAWLTKRGK